MANEFSYIALAVWPLISVVFFLMMRNVDAAFATLIFGWMFLPERVSVDINLLPSIDKYSVTALCACICLAIFARKNIFKLRDHKKIRWLVFGFVLLPFFVFVTNREPVFNGMRFIQGLTPRDIISMIFEQLLYLIPFLVGLKCVYNKVLYERILLLILLSAAAYSLPALLEVRLSPQLHNWIYGFFPHSFVQQMRFGGFRPVVFLGHGLEVAFFFTLAFMISIAYAVHSKWTGKSKLYSLFPIILFVLIFYSKTFAAYIVAFVGILFMLTKDNRVKRLIAIGVLSVSMLYPVAQLTGTFPTGIIVASVERVNSDRAQSLSFRFMQEDELKERVLEKPVFGWGGWARNRFEYSVTDSFWIFVSGKLGLIGLLLYSFPIIYSVRRLHSASKSRFVSRKDKTLCVNSSIVVSLYSIFLIPNYGISPLYLFFLGATIGFASSITKMGAYEAVRSGIPSYPEVRRQNTIR